MKRILCLLLSAMLALSAGAALASENIWTDGVYAGTAEGRNGAVSVEATVENARLTALTVTQQQETAGIADGALSEVPARIVAAQTPWVDAVAGATLTSNALMNAAAQALTLAGATFAPAADAQKTQGEPLICDALIVGGGLAGMMAAIELGESYPELRTVLVEKTGSLGGDLPYSGGYITGFQADYAGEKNHTMASAADYRAYFENIFTANQKDGYIPADTQINPVYVENVFAKAQRTVDLMFAAGVPFPDDLSMAGQSVYSNFYSVTGGENFGSSATLFRDALARRLAQTGVTVLLQTEAIALLSTANAATGATVQDASSIYDIQAGAVVLSTGSIADSPEKMLAYLPEYIGKIDYSTGASTGAAIDFTRAFGTPVVGAGALGSLVSNDSTWVTLQSRFMVDENGKRYLNEAEDDYRLGYDTMANTGNAWILCDQDYADAHADEIALKLAENDIQAYDSLDALAAAAGIDAAGLAQTVADYNAAVDAGADPAFGLPLSEAHPLRTAPFYVEKLANYYFETFVGVKTDELSRVLNAEGKPVEGLYAIGQCSLGNVMTGLYGQGGTGLTWAAASGVHVAGVIGEK